MSIQVLNGDCREILPTLLEGSVQCCVTSPPYFGLRDYGVAGQIGLESTPDEFIAAMVLVFREVRRVLADDGTLWLNLGDSYCSTDKWGGGKGGNTDKQLRYLNVIVNLAVENSPTPTSREGILHSVKHIYGWFTDATQVMPDGRVEEGEEWVREARKFCQQGLSGDGCTPDQALERIYEASGDFLSTLKDQTNGNQ